MDDQNILSENQWNVYSCSPKVNNCLQGIGTELNRVHSSSKLISESKDWNLKL